MKKVVTLIGLSALLFACEKEDTVAPQNYPPTIFTVMQQPGQRLVFEFSFSADQVNLLLVQKAGQVLVSRNIDSVNAQTPFDTGINTTNAAITYEITHKFKTNRKDRKWLNGVGRPDTLSSEQIAYEFDDRDAVDSDYNDAVVKVTSSYK